MGFSLMIESRSTDVSTSTADDKIEFEAKIYMTEGAVEGDIYPVGFGIEVDTAEVWVFYFNLTADPPSGAPKPVKCLRVFPSTCIFVYTCIYIFCRETSCINF
jgi:hypothetical protein